MELFLQFLLAYFTKDGALYSIGRFDPIYKKSPWVKIAMQGFGDCVYELF